MTAAARIALLEAALRDLRDHAAATVNRIDLRLDVTARVLNGLQAACNRADLVLDAPPPEPAAAGLGRGAEAAE
jgi:hypothetical protein